MKSPQTTIVWFLAALAITTSASGPSALGGEYSSMIYGPLGLNTIPSARMDETGTIRLGVSTLDPYLNGYLGFQLADPLYVQLRQTAEASNINEDPDRLYPGVDLKLRLVKESRSRPEISVGLQSAIGHRRMAGEYIATSKRWGDFDFTTGLGWGRFGTAGHFNNPLKAISNHFGKQRALDGELPNQIEDWFTGEQIGIFGGLEYFTPLKGLSVKLDYGADHYSAERTSFDFNAPAPWAIGVNFKPAPWVDLSVAAQGRDKIMGRISLQNLLPKWPRAKTPDGRKPMRAYRTGLTLPGNMELDAHGDKVYITGTSIEGENGQEAQTHLVLNPHINSPAQMKLAALNMANHGGPAVEKLTITPMTMGLKGPSVSIMRTDLEKALAHHQGSAQEIWKNARFNEAESKPVKKDHLRRQDFAGLTNFHLTLDTQLSLAEEDSGALHRTALLGGVRAPTFYDMLDTGVTMRLNGPDNLDRLTQIRPLSPDAVRSDVQYYAQQDLAVENLYLAYSHSFTPELHAIAVAGYLEEMYAGMGGEILYRPFKSRFAVGGEAWKAYRRSPFTTMNLGFFSRNVKTAHLNAWYDIPAYDLTLYAKAGQYLAEDKGLTLGLNKIFDNGAKLEGFVTISDTADFDLFGGVTHSDHGLRLVLPLGGIPYVPNVPNAVKLESRFQPFGRDIGQSIRSPVPLYDATEPFSYAHIIRNWPEITGD